MLETLHQGLPHRRMINLLCRCQKLLDEYKLFRETVLEADWMIASKPSLP